MLFQGERTPEQVFGELLAEQLHTVGSIDANFLRTVFEQISTEHLKAIVDILLQYDFYAYCLVGTMDFSEVTDRLPDTPMTLFVTPAPIPAQLSEYHEALLQSINQQTDTAHDPEARKQRLLDELKAAASVSIELVKKN